MAAAADPAGSDEREEVNLEEPRVAGEAELPDERG